MKTPVEGKTEGGSIALSKDRLLENSQAAHPQIPGEHREEKKAQEPCAIPSHGFRIARTQSEVNFVSPYSICRISRRFRGFVPL